MLSLGRSDLILDVMRAADPARAQDARKRLGAPSGTDSFGAALANAVTGERVSVTSQPGVGASQPFQPPHKIPRGQTVGQSFEAAMLRPFLDSILSSGPSNAFGSGLAGSSFRGFFLDHLSEQLSQSSRLGLARMIDGRVREQVSVSLNVPKAGEVDANNS